MAAITDGVLQPLSEVLPLEAFPQDLFASNDSNGSILERIFLLESTMVESEEGTILAATIAFEREVVIGLPACPSVSLVVGAGVPDYTIVRVRVLVASDWHVEFEQFQIGLRVDPSVLRPVDAAKPFTEIAISTTVRLTANTIDLVEAPAMTLPKSYLAGTEIAVSATNLKFDFRRDASIPEVAAAGLGNTFMGIYVQNAQVALPPDLVVPLPANLTFSECFIGSGGFTGEVRATWGAGGGAPAPRGTLFGFAFELQSVALALRESSFVEAGIVGLIDTLPYFDKPALVDVSIGEGGQLSVSLAATQPAGIATSPEGLLRLEVPNAMRLDVAALAFEHDAAGTRAYLSGTVTPLVGAGVAWPALEVKRLGVDSRGKITIEGGWIDLPEQYAIDFGGFAMELSKIGFGNVEGSQTDKWFGLTGSIRLTEFLPAGASVDGLRVEFTPGVAAVRVSFQGIGLEFGVPNVFRFAGKVAYFESPGRKEFRGSALLELDALDVSVEAQVVIGRSLAAPAFNYAYLLLDAKLCPSGIPILNTGLNLYGLAGLYAQNMAPSLDLTVPESDRWYAWYRNPQPGAGDPTKWVPVRDRTAIGLGATVGTVDAGFSFSAKALVIVLLPNPVLVVDGKAKFLNLPAPEAGASEGDYGAFALYDSRSGIIELAVDAKYNIPILLDAHADARAHFETADSSKWFVSIGEYEPASKRASAHLFKGLVDGWMYVRIDPDGAEMGTGIEFDKRISAGPGWIEVKASASLFAKLSSSPKQFEAHGTLKGRARAGIKGVGVGVTIKVGSDVAASRPFLIEAKFKACADLLLKTVCVTFPYEKKDNVAPTIPPAVAAISIRHPHPLLEAGGVPPASSWPLDLGGAIALGVPPDGLIDITFTRQVANATGAFINGDSCEDKWHLVGEKSGYWYRYRLTGIRLYDEGGGTAAEVANASAGDLSGAWQVSSAANTVLGIGATTPFSGSSSSITHMPAYDGTLTPGPCDPLPPPTTERVCEDVIMSAEVASTWGLAVKRGSKTFVVNRVPAAAQPPPSPVGNAPAKQPGPKGPKPCNCVAPVRHSFVQILVNVVRDPRRRWTLLFLLALAAVVIPLARNEHRMLAILVLAVALILYIGIVTVGEWLSDEVAFITCGPGCRCRGYPDGGRVDPSGGDGGAGGGGGSGGGPVVVRVCRDVPVTDNRTRETPEDRQARLAAWIEEIETWAQPKPILNPNHQYRLEVDVETSLVKNDDQVSLASSTQVVRFTIGGPPSETGALQPYVLWTMPAFTPGATARRAYRAYDLGVLFSEDYVDVMYIASGDNLQLHLVDNNGDAVLDANGNPIVLANAWSHAPARVLTREESIIRARLAAGTCLPKITWQTQPLATASPTGSGAVLRPETYYEVRVLRKNDVLRKALARWSFVTSRFETFSTMVGTFTPGLALPLDASALAAVALATSTFETISSALGILPAAHPTTARVTPLRAGSGATSSHGVLLDFPEPIEWRRITATLRAGAPAATYAGVSLRVVPNADETMAFVFALDGSGAVVALPDGPCELDLSFARYVGSADPIYAVGGDTTSELSTLRFTLGEVP
jgi:hypothetical protein